jgi:flagellar motor switch protein FliM
MEDRGGRIELLLPYATLEPVRELLLQMFMGEKFGRDSIWEGHLATELWYTQVQIEAVLDEKVMKLGKVMELEVGDTVMFNSTQDSEVELRCGGVSLLAGRMGRVGSTMAIRVTDQIRNEDKD